MSNGNQYTAHECVDETARETARGAWECFGEVLRKISGLEAQMSNLEQRLGRRIDSVNTLPLARPESPSSIDLAAEAQKAARNEFKKMASRSPGPLLETSPDEAARVTAQVVERVLAAKEQSAAIRAGQDRLAAIDAAAAQRNRAIFKVIMAFAIALATAAGASAWTRATSLAEGHQRGVEDERSHHHNDRSPSP